MSKYVSKAEAEAAAYEEERKKQEEAEVAASNRQYEAERQAAAFETAEAMRDKEQEALWAMDTAAVQQAVTEHQVREQMARLGLTASGGEQARLSAAETAARRTTHAAQRSEREAVTALTEALQREEARIEAERAANEVKLRNKSESDIAAYRKSLMQSAYSAESRETAAQTRADKAAANAENSLQEKNRRLALEKLYGESVITLEMYVKALEGGWSVEETMRYKAEYSRVNDVITEAQRLYTQDGIHEAAKYLVQNNLTDADLDRAAATLGIPRAQLDREIRQYVHRDRENPAKGGDVNA